MRVLPFVLPLLVEAVDRAKRREGRTVYVDHVEVVGEIDEPIVGRSVKAGRNGACPCGSGKKYKKCCRGQAKRRKEQGR